MQALDDALRIEYEKFGMGADKILCDPAAFAQFSERVNTRLAAPADEALVKDRLMTLRKRGSAHGGLPRIKRTYFGRKNRNG